MSRGLAWGLVAAAVALGAVLRAIPCWNDFWLDEIWTYFDVRGLTSPLAVFTSIHHSNNHHLNTLFFYWIGDTSHWAAYRIPSLVLGTASVALAAGFAARRGRLEAVLAAVLTAFCFALIHFSSEARGYAPMVCFALLAIAMLQPEMLALRYFLIGIAFTLLLAAFTLAQALRAGGALRAVALAALAVFLDDP